MASCGRTHLIKAALLASVILLILFNFYNLRFETSKIKFISPTSESFLHLRSSQWPKRTHTTAEHIFYARSRIASQHADPTGQQHNDSTPADATAPDSTQTTNNDRFHHKNGNESNTLAEYSADIYAVNDSDGQPSIAAGASAIDPSSDRMANVDDHILEPPMPPINVHANHINQSYSSFKAHFQLHQERNLAAEQQSNHVGPKQLLKKIMSTFGINMCSDTPPNLTGPINIDISFESMAIVEQRLTNKLQPGGWYKPKQCNAKNRVAIVIPYRDRPNHLPVFLKNIHPFLQKQQIEYGIFIVEQIADGQFNRAALMNVGFVEALKLNEWDCFIFHDIDLIPMDDRNLYTCPDQPRHMSVAVDTMGFKLPYSSLFGGVSAMTVKQFRTVNGFSNSFWGWGGEDDDMSNRLKHVGYHIARYPVNIARYTMLTHRKEKANPKRYEKLVNGVKKFDTEGLNSLKYKVHLLEKKPLYTWILVEIKQDSGS